MQTQPSHTLSSWSTMLTLLTVLRLGWKDRLAAKRFLEGQTDPHSPGSQKSQPLLSRNQVRPSPWAVSLGVKWWGCICLHPWALRTQAAWKGWVCFVFKLCYLPWQMRAEDEGISQLLLWRKRSGSSALAGEETVGCVYVALWRHLRQWGEGIHICVGMSVRWWET